MANTNHMREILYQIRLLRQQLIHLESQLVSAYSSVRYSLGRIIILPFSVLKFKYKSLIKHVKDVLLREFPEHVIQFLFVKNKVGHSWFQIKRRRALRSALSDADFKRIIPHKFPISADLLKYQLNENLDLLYTSDNELFNRMDHNLDIVGQKKKLISNLVGSLYFRKAHINRSGKSKIILDSRSLQDEGLINRGVGRYVKNIVEILASLEFDFYLLFEHSLKIPKEFDAYNKIYSLQDQIVDEAIAFINPSPMTDNNPTLLNKVLSDTGIYKIALIYDFIPLELPYIYLHDYFQYLKYLNCFKSLPNYDHCIAISKSTSLKYQTLFTKNNVSVAWPTYLNFEDARPKFRSGLNSKPLSVTIVSGDDVRKNYDQAILSVCYFAIKNNEPIDLYIIGLKDKADYIYNKYSKIADSCKVTIVVCPYLSSQSINHLIDSSCFSLNLSMAEGLSLPVIESILLKVPVVASAIDAHRDILGKGPWLVRNRSLKSIYASMNYVYLHRDSVIESQGIYLRQNKECELNDVLRKLISEFLVRKSHISNSFNQNLKVAKTNLAIVSPLPNQDSAIARFTYKTLMETDHKNFNITYFATGNTNIKGDYRVLPEDINYLSNFDEVVLVLGNSHHHVPCLSVLKSLPCKVLLHDTRHLELNSLLMNSEALANNLGNSSHSAMEQIQNPKLLSHGSLTNIFMTASSVACHSKQLSSYLLNELQLKTTTLVFPSIPRDFSHSSKVSRSFDTLHLGVFGRIDFRTKMELEIIEAVKILEKYTTKKISLFFVGHCSDHDRLIIENRAKFLGMRSNVFVTGAVDESRYVEYLENTNIGIDLRRSGILSLSGVIPELIVYGIPSLITSELFYDHDCPNFMQKIDSCSISPFNVSMKLLKMIEIYGELRPDPKVIGEYQELHSVELYQDQFFKWVSQNVD
jgi:glycosyltransferase involved in cell wall biosynthesis